MDELDLKILELLKFKAANNSVFEVATLLRDAERILKKYLHENSEKSKKEK